jgi:hypothetical protein
MQPIAKCGTDPAVCPRSQQDTAIGETGRLHKDYYFAAVHRIIVLMAFMQCALLDTRVHLAFKPSVQSVQDRAQCHSRQTILAFAQRAPTFQPTGTTWILQMRIIFAIGRATAGITRPVLRVKLALVIFIAQRFRSRPQRVQ